MLDLFLRETYTKRDNIPKGIILTKKTIIQQDNDSISILYLSIKKISQEFLQQSFIKLQMQNSRWEKGYNGFHLC